MRQGFVEVAHILAWWNYGRRGLHLYTSAVVCCTNTGAPEHACTLHVFLK